jgi:N-acetylmuramoyl-L-alanine amidase
MNLNSVDARRSGLAGLIVLLLLSAECAGAVTTTYEAVVGGEKRGVTISSVDVNGVQYYPLRSIANQLGGGCQVKGGRVQVDLASQTAWIGLNDTAVDGSVARSALLRPIVRQDNEVLIAAGDVVPFFKKSFRVDLTATASDLDTSSARSKSAEPAIPLDQPVDKPAAPSEAHPAPGASASIGVVIIDPGHGGANGGAESERSFKEKDLTLAIARQLKKALEQSKSVKVLLTRDGDTDVALRDRLGFAAKNKGELYICLHAGASLSNAVSGVALFVPPSGEIAVSETRPGSAPAPVVRQDYSAPSLQIATAAATSLSAATSAPILGVRAVRTRVLRNLAMPSMLVEVGCLTNAEESAQLQTEAYQAKIAAGLAEAILKFTAPPAAGGSQ